MIPTLVVLFGTFLVVLAVERLRKRGDGAIGRVGRIALAALFLFTGVSHFFFTEKMAEMVPPPLPATATVLVTGILEVLGAVGLLVTGTSRLAAWCLFAFLLAVFPANVYAAINHAGMGGHVDGPGYLPLRGPLQLLFLSWTWYFGIRRPERGRNNDLVFLRPGGPDLTEAPTTLRPCERELTSIPSPMRICSVGCSRS